MLQLLHLPFEIPELPDTLFGVLIYLEHYILDDIEFSFITGRSSFRFLHGLGSDNRLLPKRFLLKNGSDRSFADSGSADAFLGLNIADAVLRSVLGNAQGFFFPADAHFCGALPCLFGLPGGFYSL